MTELENVDGDGVRLAKRVAAQLGCSRAEAERYIAGGWVSVDGTAEEDPATRVTPEQQVALLPGATAEEPLPVTILLHKPAGVGTTAALAALGTESQSGNGRFLKRHLHKLALATPLETAASGLVVFTQDWRVQRKLVEDGARMEHEYVLEVVDEYISENALAAMNAAGTPAAPIKVSRQSETRLRIAGKGIRAGRIEVMCKQAGLAFKSLRRLRVGRVALSSLPAGQWRYMQEFERF
ncbi:RNA pseudouridine synthase [Massilia phyllosphaerae]|uniref:RNA pseudouridine synthase n=1 Tax=Massilia phyllosphaerae TaxID=3106034 RepID=UPI002B1CE1F4|nr:RNA pseudouridine synthase [Massilia sp. SGZ-792]